MVLYDDNTYKSAKSNMLLRFGALALTLAITVAAVIVFVGPVRNQYLAIAACALGACVMFFLLSMKALPWYHYWHYQADIRKGRTHEADCAFVSLSDGERTSDGVAFRDFIVELDSADLPGDNDPKDAKNADRTRLFLWDADKIPPTLKPGDKLHLRSFGNYIIALEAR